MNKLIVILIVFAITAVTAANLSNKLKIEKNSNYKYYIVNDSKHLLRTSDGTLDEFDTIASAESFYADLLFSEVGGDRLIALVALSNVSTYEKDPSKGMEIKSKNDLVDLDEVGGEISIAANGADAKIESLDNVNSLSYLILPDIMQYLTELALPLPTYESEAGAEWFADKTEIQKYDFASLESHHKIRYKLTAFKEYKGYQCAEIDFETVTNDYTSKFAVSAFKSKIMGKALIEAATGVVVNLQISTDFTLIADNNGLNYNTETSSFTEISLRSRE